MGDTGVISTAANGLVLIVIIAWGLRAPLSLDPLHLPRAALVFAGIMALAIRALPRSHPFARFGPANQVTAVRAALVSVVASLIGAPASPPVALVAVAIASTSAALDGVDGWLARRTGMASAFGARFDMEVDALLILALSLLAWQHGKAGAWVVWSGALRYLFVAAGWALPWMRRRLPDSRRRQTVCVIQVAALIAVMAIEPPASAWLAGAALSALTGSFAVDTLWLWRHAAPVRS